MTTKQAGDWGRYAIPVVSGVSTLVLKDFEGLGQLALSVVLVQGVTEGLKRVTNERRPNGSCCLSFPSGHVSSAFTGASFVHFRYGFKYSVPLYLGSAFVAYSRVNVKAHYLHDVIAGGLIGIAGTYLSTTPYLGGHVAVEVDQGYAGIIYRKIFD